MHADAALAEFINQSEATRHWLASTMREFLIASPPIAVNSVVLLQTLAADARSCHALATEIDHDLMPCLKPLLTKRPRKRVRKRPRS